MTAKKRLKRGHLASEILIREMFTSRFYSPSCCVVLRSLFVPLLAFALNNCRVDAEIEKRKETMEGKAFNCDFLVPVNQNLECGICKTVMLKPVTLRCGHSGCHDCLASLLQYHQQKGKHQAPCHICRTTNFDKDSLTINFALDSITSDLDVKCLNMGCTWKGKFPKAQQHDKECIYRLVNCPSTNCQLVMKREEIDAHLMACGKRTVPCPECQQFVERDELTNHSSSGCVFAKISCPLDCGLNLPWCHVTIHVSQCPEKAIACSVCGCKQIFRRKLWEEHMRICALSHAVETEGEIQRLKRMMYTQNYSAIPAITLNENTTCSFRWEIENFRSRHIDSVVASPSFRSLERHTWRGIWNKSLFLQLQSAVNPVTAKIRVVWMQGKTGGFSLPVTELNEGEMIEVGAESIKNAVINDKLVVKFIITTLTYN